MMLVGPALGFNLSITGTKDEAKHFQLAGDRTECYHHTKCLAEDITGEPRLRFAM
jgi:hypothetical protein